ncbi:FAD binding domain-containing protein [Variovorax sp. dw_308]|uniref:FAD binding domain-containing protein n=1 Tax=Variovorax sp. dw_308 TaxID=2721546 RepID=UPI001C45732F|nr:FAD binding domain-containing protein [Variovorax sp. dw_308]
MISSRKAIVIGGSLGGLFAANMLLRAGWDVHVYERVADELQGRGAGIVTHPELMAALATAGIAVDDDFGVEVRQRITLAQDGSVRGARDMPQKLTAWGHMYHVLRSGIPDARYHNGKQFVSFTQDETSITATFKDGEQVRGDLLLAADGLRSAVRQSLLPGATPAYAGYIAWRGLVEESSLSPRARQELFPYFAFGLPPREQMIAYPVAGKGNAVEPGKRRYNFVWYRPADEATTLRDMMTDASGKTWPDGIPPPLIRPEVLAEARRSADEVLAPQFAEVVHKTESLFFQPIFDLESPRLAFDRVALLGDAAFVARPHCGMGVTKAAGDAVALVDALQGNDDIATALRVYEKGRLAFGRFIVSHARALGAYMQAQIRTPEEQAMAERYRTHDAVMDETAVAPAMHLVTEGA